MISNRLRAWHWYFQGNFTNTTCSQTQTIPYFSPVLEVTCPLIDRAKFSTPQPIFPSFAILPSYHCIASIIGQNDRIYGRCVVGNTNASFLRFVFPAITRFVVRLPVVPWAPHEAHSPIKPSGLSASSIDKACGSAVSCPLPNEILPPRSTHAVCCFVTITWAHWPVMVMDSPRQSSDKDPGARQVDHFTQIVFHTEREDISIWRMLESS